MKLLNILKQRKLSINSAFESFIMTLLAIFIGYLIDKKDPIFLDFTLNLSLILVTIIALFHGLFSAIISVFLISSTMLLYYTDFSFQLFFELMLFALIIGEFHWYWKSNIKKNYAEATYYKEKLDQLSTAFYTLKISHDQLEKNYILQPVTVRSSINEIKNIAKDDEKKSMNEFFKYVAKTFGIKAWGLYEYKESYIKPIIETKVDLVNFEDLLLQKSIEKRESIFVSSTNEKIQKNTDILAAIPIMNGIFIDKIFIIQDMPFMNFNKDNLTKISILIFYFFDLMTKEVTIKNLPINLDYLQDISKYELFKLIKVYEKFTLDSSIIIFKVRNDYIYNRLSKIIKKYSRSLDIYSFKNYEGLDIIAVILPFTQLSSAEGFTARIMELIKNENIIKQFEKDSAYDIFTIENLNEIEKFIRS